jgi:hypothetical protein
MLQVFQMNVASVSSKCLYLFQTYVCKRFDLHVAYVSHICCKSMFQIFQSYAAANVSAVFRSMLQVFYLVVASVFILMLQWLYTYVANVCFRMFYLF